MRIVLLGFVVISLFIVACERFCERHPGFAERHQHVCPPDLHPHPDDCGLPWTEPCNPGDDEDADDP